MIKIFLKIKAAELKKKLGLKDGKDGINGQDGINGIGKDGKDGSPDSPPQIVEKLESLKDEDRLDASAIKNLKEYFDEEITKLKMSGKTVYIGGGQGGGRIVKSYDISSQLNGVLKTFSLPAFHRIISIHSSSFPNTFRETVDWTSNASAMTITFTSEITASSTLATGQTITIIYSEA